MDRIAVINASPLIFLSRGLQLQLLRHFASKVLVPQPVADEILQRGPQDLTAKAIRETPWIESVRVPDIPMIIQEWGLGAGESSVLAYALSHPGVETIIDDRSGRNCGAFLGIPVRGTLGIVLMAKKRGLIPFARPVIEELIQAGLYLSRHVIDKALQRVNE